MEIVAPGTMPPLTSVMRPKMLAGAALVWVLFWMLVWVLVWVLAWVLFWAKPGESGRDDATRGLVTGLWARQADAAKAPSARADADQQRLREQRRPDFNMKLGTREEILHECTAWRPYHIQGMGEGLARWGTPGLWGIEVRGGNEI